MVTRSGVGQQILAFIEVLLLGLWLGAMAFFSFAVAPGAFETLGVRELAGRVVTSNIIKVDKMPFGPEKRRTAGIGAIKNVSFRSSFIGRLIGYGTVEVQTGSLDTNITMEYLPDPREIVATIYEYMVEHKASERERTLNDTLTLLLHFHESQKDHGEFFAEVRPATSMVEVKNLIDPKMLVEIEAEAYLGE